MVSVNKETCIGCYTCSVICRSVFVMKKTESGMKAEIIEGMENSVGKEVDDAKEICPTNAIN